MAVLPLVHAVAERLRPVALRAGARLYLGRIEPMGVICAGDPAVLRQVISSALYSAIRLGEPGGVINISARLVEPIVEIAVGYCGRRAPDGGPETAPPDEGAGLDMAHSYALARSVRGELRVCEGPNGSHVIAASFMAALTRPAFLLPPHLLNPEVRLCGRILAACREPEDLERLECIAATLGDLDVEAAPVAELHLIALRTRPSLTCLDLSLEGAGAAVRAMKAYDETRGIPILGLRDARFDDRSLASLLDAVIMRPLDPTGACARVSELLEGVPQSRGEALRLRASR